MKPLDLTKPLQTRDGRPAKFLHKLRDDRFPIVVVVESPRGHEMLMCYSINGSSASTCIYQNDCLINVPVKHVREYWVNLYTTGQFSTHSTKEEADGWVITKTLRLACKKITVEFEENEGL